MAVHEDLYSIIRKLRWCGRNSQFLILKDIASSVQNATGNDLKMLLELVNTANNTDLQVKLFSVLTSYLITNDTNIDTIMNCNPIYDKINNLLSKNHPQKTSILLNFLTLLLYPDDEEGGTTIRQGLILHAKNMIRISGCLATMADFFISGMMYQDTWRALCRCLVQSCNGSELNQRFCSHLIPTCVQRCIQGSIEALPVLQGLVCNHEHSIQIFIESNGMSLFTGESLQHTMCMQLLCTVIQTSTLATLKAQNTKIFEYVQDILKIYGPYSQIGQWATIILFYADARIKGHGKLAKTDNATDQLNKNESVNKAKVDFEEPNEENTTVLFQNVINEIINCQPKKKPKHPNTFVAYDKKPNCRNRGIRENIIPSDNRLSSETCTNLKGIGKFSTNNRRRSNQSNPSNELSFSFLQKQHYMGRTENTTLDNNIRNINIRTPIIKENKSNQTGIRNVADNGKTNRVTCSQGDTSIYSCTHKCGNENSVVNMEVFKPVFASTPNNSNIITKTYRSIASHKPKTSNNIKKDYGIQKSKTSRIIRQNEQKIVSSELKQRSMSSRFFDAINDSCTTLVKTVQSIFKPNKNNKCKSGNDRSCSYSFTNYMRKRDAVLADDCTTNKFASEDFSVEVDSCKTCNDTIVLKNKMANDEYLKGTVKKLKLGINLYGCDFKKIAHTMWPRESYMTPVVLYNLYRKLIIK